jgi:hypothetical protein
MVASYAKLPEAVTGYARPAPPADGKADIPDIVHRIDYIDADDVRNVEEIPAGAGQTLDQAGLSR